MVNKTCIERNLRELTSRYNRKSRNPRDALYYSKLALIELCGWIEQSMDSIVRDCAEKHLTDSKNLKHVESEIIRRTYSFTYEPHFRDMLIRVIGLVRVEELEGLLDSGKFQAMKSSLGSLKQRRDQQVHTLYCQHHSDCRCSFGN